MNFPLDCKYFTLSIYAKQFVTHTFIYLPLRFNLFASICKILTLEKNMFYNNQYNEIILICGQSNRDKRETIREHGMEIPDQN